MKNLKILTVLILVATTGGKASGFYEIIMGSQLVVSLMVLDGFIELFECNFQLLVLSLPILKLQSCSSSRPR